MTADEFRAMALDLHGVSEQAHMNHPDFRIQGRIFASLLSNDQQGGLNLSPDEQRELLHRHPTVFTRASGTWGQQGWTIVHLAKAETAIVRGALMLAYEQVAATIQRRRARKQPIGRGPGSPRRLRTPDMKGSRRHVMRVNTRSEGLFATDAPQQRRNGITAVRLTEWVPDFSLLESTT